MITKLTLIEPGWSVTPEHVNATRAKLNEIIEALNAFINILETDGTSSTMKTTMCPRCQGLGTIGG